VAYLPWDHIHELLLYAGAAEDRADLYSRILNRLGRIIPWDVGVGVFDRSIRCEACGGWDRRTFEQYNAYYHAKVPFIAYDPNGVARRGRDIVLWNRIPDSEFIRDFARPLGLHSGLSPFRPAWPRVLSLQRSRESPPFTARDCEILDIINGHMHNYLSLLDRCETDHGGPSAAYGRDSAERSRAALRSALKAAFRLSDRELELLEGLCEGLSNKALAKNLFISERTVKAHLSSIFRKTGCQSRLELAALARRAY
jgi:DNA-binding CsgD family transcriptional regulator